MQAGTNLAGRPNSPALVLPTHASGTCHSADRLVGAPADALTPAWPECARLKVRVVRVRVLELEWETGARLS